MKKMNTPPPDPTWYLAMGNNRPFFGGIGLLAIALLARGPALAADLNDTGIATYGNASSNDLTSEPTDYPGQDASHGRDAAAKAGLLTKVGGGNAGFDFTKIGATGNTLSASATTWSCVRDNVTGLLWEVKSNGRGMEIDLHDTDWTFTWYNSTGINDGGSAGTAAGGSCGGMVAGGCDTEKIVAAVNDAHFCGAVDWRLPSFNELLSIVDYSQTQLFINTNYFPNTYPTYYWSSSPNAGNSNIIVIDFGTGNTISDTSRGSANSVRLVSGGGGQ